MPDRELFLKTLSLYREQFYSDLKVSESVDEEWISVGTFPSKGKITAKPQHVVDLTFAEKARR